MRSLPRAAKLVLPMLSLSLGVTVSPGPAGADAPPARTERLTPPDAPRAIQPPPGHRVFLVVHAVGTQSYECAGAEWGPAIPQADLLDQNGHAIGIHVAGPLWQLNDGSSVRGVRLASALSPDGAISWLLLQAVATTKGRLGGTTYIQRVNTTRGMAPDDGCGEGEGVSVPFTADYYFYRADDVDPSDIRLDSWDEP